MFGLRCHEASARRDVGLLALADRVDADGALELEDEAGADRLDDRRRSRLLAMLDLVEVGVLVDRDERDGPAARDARDLVGEQRALGDEDARRAGSADELVRRQEDGVLVGEMAVGPGAFGVHLDVEVGPGRGVVPERQRAVAVQQRRDLLDVREDPGDVRRGREAADLQRPVGVELELRAQVVEVEAAVGILADDAQLGDRLAPRKLVGVVLVGPDEDDRPLAGRDERRQAVALLEALGDPQAERPHDLVDRGRGARPAEDDDVVLRAADRRVHEAPRVVAQAHRLAAGGRRLGVGVGVERQDLVADEVLDEAQRPARGGVVGVDDALGAERPGQDEVVADHRAPDEIDERGALLCRGRERGERIEQLGRLIRGAVTRRSQLAGEGLAGAVQAPVRSGEVGDQRLEEPQRQRRAGIRERVERVPAEFEHDRVSDRRAGRGTGAAVDERDLSEDLAGTEHPEAQAPLVALHRHLDGPFGDDVQRVARRARREDELAIGEHPLAHVIENAAQVVVLEPGEEPAAAQQRVTAVLRRSPPRGGGRGGPATARRRRRRCS